MWLAISTRPDISNAGTVPCQKPFIGKRRSVFLRTLMVLLTLSLRIKEGHYQIFFRGFCRHRLRQQSDRQEICVWRSHYEGRSMYMLVFLGRRNVLHFRRLKQNTSPLVML